MIKIGITGSLGSGKTTASKMLSFRRGPLFSADKAVKELYQNKKFKLVIEKSFKIKNNNQIKKSGINNISITNRTNEKCIFLKKKFNFLTIIPWTDLKSEIKNFDIIINATSLGLKNGDDFNFNFANTKNEVIYIDTVYNPLETKTFKYLKEEGRKVFNGLDMFIYQGQKSFYLWNKVNPEIDDGLIELLNSKLK